MTISPSTVPPRVASVGWGDKTCPHRRRLRDDAPIAVSGGRGRIPARGEYGRRVGRPRHRRSAGRGRRLLDLAVVFGLAVAALGLAGGHLDDGRLSQAFGLQGTAWARHQAWGERWWSYAVWAGPLLAAGVGRATMASARRDDDANGVWAGALGALAGMLLLGFVVVAGTPGLLSTTAAQAHSRLLFVVGFVLPVPVLLAAAALLAAPATRADR
jgi:hypothetical protein